MTKKTDTKKYRAVSLFSNCGAGDVGFSKAGFQFEVMAELDPRRLEVCLLNHPNAIGVEGDLRKTWTQVIEKYREKCGNEPPKLLCACPPCQGMSSARSGRGKLNDADAGSKDERNLLVEVIAKVTKELEPLILVVENVPAFLTRKVRHPETNEPISAANLLISRLSKNYDVFPLVTDLSDYGVPQTRKRAFLTFVKKDINGLKQFKEASRVPFPRPTHPIEFGGNGEVSISQALREMNLPSLDAKSNEKATSNNPLHFVPVWKDWQYSMVAAIPPNSGESAWKNNECSNCGKISANEEDILCHKCKSPLLRPIVKDNDGNYRFIKGFRTSSYRRMSPNKPSATITTASGHIGSDNTIHPFENRLLSALECAYIQTFPSDFQWGDALKKWGHTNIRSMIGEAVPPLFTQLHGKILASLLNDNWALVPLSANDERYLSALKKLHPLGDV